MFIKKKIIIISLLSAIVVFIGCLLAVYTVKSQPSEIKNSDLYGTYQFDIRNLDNAEYLAIIPPSSGDSNENEGLFQLYNIDNEVLNQGTCKIEKEGYVTLYVDQKIILTMFFVQGKYYFVDYLLEPQEITKISEEPMVSSPIQ